MLAASLHRNTALSEGTPPQWPPGRVSHPDGSRVPSSQPGKTPGPRASRRVPPTWLWAHWQCQGFTRRRAPARPLLETRKVLCECNLFLARGRALPPRARTRGARLPAPKPALPQVRKGQQGAERALKAPLASIRPPAPGRTPRSKQEEREVWGSPKTPPPSCCRGKTTPLLWGRAPASPPPSPFPHRATRVPAVSRSWPTAATWMGT